MVETKNDISKFPPASQRPRDPEKYCTANLTVKVPKHGGHIAKLEGGVSSYFLRSVTLLVKAGAYVSCVKLGYLAQATLMQRFILPSTAP